MEISTDLLGCLNPPYDPKREKYALSRRPIAQSIEPYEILLPDDCLIDIAEQTMGSCAAVSACVAASMADLLGNKQHRYSNAAWLYFWGRIQGKLMDLNNPATWKDYGSYPDVNLGILKNLAPKADNPNELIGDPKWRPPQSIEDGPRIDQVLSYAPCYPATEGMQTLCTAIANKMPVVLAMAWPSTWMQPKDGILPIITNPSGIKSGHAVAYRGSLKINGELYGVGINQWTKGWTTNMQSIHPRLRDGEFLIHRKILESPMVWLGEAVSFEPFTPQPDNTEYLRGRQELLQEADQISIDVQAELAHVIQQYKKNTSAYKLAQARYEGSTYLADRFGELLGMGRKSAISE